MRQSVISIKDLLNTEQKESVMGVRSSTPKAPSQIYERLLDMDKQRK